MILSGLQTWLNAHGANLVVDGKPGPATREALKAAFVNKSAPSVTPADIEGFAAELGCTTKQIAAVAKVESAGKSFDKEGRPKILFEQHKFWQATEGRYGVTIFSNPHPGDYDFDSWEKLARAACKDVDAAFASASWGGFQVMGSNWRALGYTSPLEMAYAMTRDEATHYQALVGFIKANNLTAAVRALSADPETCRAFASGYNGGGYRKNAYHEKLAAAMR